MDPIYKNQVETARITGIFYLLLAITGMLGFMILHPKIYVADPAITLENLTSKESIARARLVFELLIIVSQALTAVWFYKLFKDINGWVAWALAIWGMMNSAMIMVSAISMGASLEVASSIQSIEDKVILINLLGLLMKNAWGVGSLFFGLWLIPMGYIIVSSNRMPRWLGFTLIIGGMGYLLSTFLKYAGITSILVDILVIPATVGEFWIVGYLLFYGIRTSNENIDFTKNG
ncbi:MAG: DUF4386 domain-containing protein [Cyclobacteriaceae bacterium]|nr:DUF4386 domain-containing protein [Cyclobacteriaceae bacterium]